MPVRRPWERTLRASTPQPLTITGGVHQERRHDSAHKHVSGEAVYVDDMPAPAGLLPQGGPA